MALPNPGKTARLPGINGIVKDRNPFLLKLSILAVPDFSLIKRREIPETEVKMFFK